MQSVRRTLGKIFSSDQFKYDREKKRFSSNVNDTPEILRQLWEDSLDIGFGIRSKRSGRIVFFTLARGEQDDDGHYLNWVFDAYNPDADPRLAGLSVVVYNLKE